MTSGKKPSSRIVLRGCLAAVAGGMLLFLSLAVSAQETRPDPAYQPGMLDSVGRWFKDSYNKFRGGIGGATDAATEAAEAAKEAADAAKEAVAKFPNAKLVDGRERCLISSNGAPDCKKAAETVCKAKGFGSGSSLEIQSSQKCAARAWISGKPMEQGDCELQTFVTRAMCQ